MKSKLKTMLRKTACLLLCLLVLPVAGGAESEKERMVELLFPDTWAQLESAVSQGEEVILTCGAGSIAGLRKSETGEPVMVRAMVDALGEVRVGPRPDAFYTDSDDLIRFELAGGQTFSFRFNRGNLEAGDRGIYSIDQAKGMWDMFEQVMALTGKIRTFSYSFGSFTMGSYRFSIQATDGGYLLSAEGWNGVNLDVKHKQLSESDMGKLVDLLDEYHVYAWNGFHEVDYDVADGYDFGLYVEDQGGGVLSAGGYMKYPEGYWPAQERLKALLLDFCAE